MSTFCTTDSRSVRLGGMVAWLLLATMWGGCGVQLSVDPPAQPADAPATSPDPSVSSVTVRFRNLATVEAVSVEFYATNRPIVTIPEELFVDAHLITSSIGLAGTGILEPLSEDVITFRCTGDLVLGTLGGSFLDNETGDRLGGGEPRWAKDDSLGLCGREVLFEFDSSNGDFIARISIND